MTALISSSQFALCTSRILVLSLSPSFLSSPTVCAVTSIGHDHTHILGNTLGSIAWYKAGIFKVSDNQHCHY